MSAKYLLTHSVTGGVTISTYILPVKKKVVIKETRIQNV